MRAWYYLNPYFPGFIFLIARLKERYRPSTKLSQSLFSWIHLSYYDYACLLGLNMAGSQSLFSWIHLSYDMPTWERQHWTLGSQSLFSWIHLSYI